jgi:twitching motility protein PilT
VEARELLRLALVHGASDLHLKVPSPPMLRINGELAAIDGYPSLNADDTVRLFLEITTEAERKTFYERQELDFSYSLESGGRFRVNAALQRSTIALSLRTVPVQVLSLAELGLPEAARMLASRPNGLVLVTGTTGSGKSTTLAAMIDHINQNQSRHIVTIEDPIEFLHSDKRSIIAQREVGSDTASYPEALRHVLRQDPDVILIGEMRDLETISTAITAAETGHLVLATLHTSSAPQTIDRVIDVFPPEQQQQIRLQLSVVLEGILAMTLLPRSNGNGRVAAVEVLIMNAAVRNLIREGKSFQIPNVMQIGGQQGSQTMDQALRSLIERRLVTVEDAMAKSNNPDELRRQLQGSQMDMR